VRKHITIPTKDGLNQTFHQKL